MRLVVVVMLALVCALVPASSLAQGATCRFILGFKTLHDLDPQAVGDCADNQAFAANGDALQHTTNGLLVWRKADNFTAFTNGAQTWINGPAGLVTRPNSERFAWEANPDGLPVIGFVQSERVGTSVEGRAIAATRIGDGARSVAFVGDTHGGPEAVTTTLIDTAIAYFTAHPAEVPGDITAYFIPSLNPDGLADGTRLNAHGIDLNRNWQTSDWTPDAYGPDGLVRGSGGPHPFSEPESSALHDFLLTRRVGASIFYHAPWGGIYAEPHSIAFAQVLARASGYPYHAPGQDTPYPLTGTAHRWADEHGEVSVLLELRGGAGIEWVPNGRAMVAAMQYEAAAPNLLRFPSGVASVLR